MTGWDPNVNEMFCDVFVEDRKLSLICIYGDCNAILPFTSRKKNVDFCSAFGIRLLVYQYK